MKRISRNGLFNVTYQIYSTCDQKSQVLFIAYSDWISAESCGIIVAEKLLGKG